MCVRVHTHILQCLPFGSAKGEDGRMFDHIVKLLFDHVADTYVIGQITLTMSHTQDGRIFDHIPVISQISF